jgi:hypothetical protein
MFLDENLLSGSRRIQVATFRQYIEFGNASNVTLSHPHATTLDRDGPGASGVRAVFPEGHTLGQAFTHGKPDSFQEAGQLSPVFDAGFNALRIGIPEAPETVECDKMASTAPHTVTRMTKRNMISAEFMIPFSFYQIL